MARTHDSYYIDAPVERVWAIGSDPARIPEWNTTAIAVKDVSGPLDQPGSRVTVVSKIVGRPLDITWKTERVEPPRFFESTATTPLGGSGRQRVEFQPEGSGTRVTIDLEYEIAPGILGNVLDKLFAERAIERDVKHSGENFKALVEQEARIPVR